MKRLIIPLALILTLALAIHVLADEDAQATTGTTGQYSPSAANARNSPGRKRDSPERLN